MVRGGIFGIILFWLFDEVLFVFILLLGLRFFCLGCICFWWCFCLRFFIKVEVEFLLKWFILWLGIVGLVGFLNFFGFFSWLCWFLCIVWVFFGMSSFLVFVFFCEIYLEIIIIYVLLSRKGYFFYDEFVVFFVDRLVLNVL